jgi:hypothetical protein
MAAEIVDHLCQHGSCKCHADESADYCGTFCKDVETSEDDQKCGCGHMACDYTKQMGNEATFDATGS